MSGQSGQGDGISCRVKGACGIIVLDRAVALNALTHGMVNEIDLALDRWETDDAVKTVIIMSAVSRAFSAGGDIRQLYDEGRLGHHGPQMAFWEQEYRLNLRIKTYPKPYVALIDGIVMGGGVGVSIHGSHVVAFDQFSFAMPEAGIGFFPDVGATWFLPRLPGFAGMRLALTGARVNADVGVALGLAHWRAPSDAQPKIVDLLIAGADADIALRQFHQAVPALVPSRFEAAFGEDDLAAIFKHLARMAEQGIEGAQQALTTLYKKSPTSLAIAFEQMRLGLMLDLEKALQVELNIVSHVCRGHDFYEGVRALAIDKDLQPRWQPADLTQVDLKMIKSWLTHRQLEISATRPEPHHE